MSLHLTKGQIVVEMPWFVKYCQLCHNNYMIENTFLYQFIEILSMAMSMSMSRANPFVVLKICLPYFLHQTWVIIFVQVFVFVLVCVFSDLWWEVVNCSLLEWAETGYRVVTPHTWQCFL